MLKISLALISIIFTMIVTTNAVIGQQATQDKQPSTPRKHAVSVTKDAVASIANKKQAGDDWAKFIVTPRGTKITPHSQSSGENRRLQSQIALALSKMNFVMDDRLNHFQWLRGQPDLAILGWRGTITGISKSPDGVGISVQIMITPDLQSSMHPISYTTDFYNENYLVLNGTITYLGGFSPERPMRAIVHE